MSFRFVADTNSLYKISISSLLRKIENLDISSGLNVKGTLPFAFRFRFILFINARSNELITCNFSREVLGKCVDTILAKVFIIILNKEYY